MRINKLPNVAMTERKTFKVAKNVVYPWLTKIFAIVTNFNELFLRQYLGNVCLSISANRLKHISPASVLHMLLDFKQLLDEVFVTSRIIKIVVMTKTESHISEDLGRHIPNVKSIKKILILVLRLLSLKLVTAVCVLFLILVLLYIEQGFREKPATDEFSRLLPKSSPPTFYIKFHLSRYLINI